MQVEGWLRRAARTRPDRVAVESLDGARTYAQLQARARAGARSLAHRGASRGDRVAIALPPGLAFAETFHACLLLGAVAVPVDLRLSAAEQRAICDGAALVIDEPRAAAAGVRAAMAAEAEEEGDGEEGEKEAAEKGEAAALDEQQAVLDEEKLHDLDAVAAIIHTSGTTSAPRPIELTYGNFLWSALGSAVALDLDLHERWLCALPVSHVGGLSILVRSAIYGTTAVVHPGWDTERVLDALRADGERGITLVSLVATTLARLLDAMPAHAQPPPRLRWALTGGGPVPQALIARAHDAGVPVSTTYGLTEACSQVTTGGPPLFCTRVRIDVETGSGGAGAGDGDHGREGEILVSGPTVARGSRDAEGWLHTGDLGALDADGNLCVTGRAADTIVSGGENVAPAEVEAVLEAHPDVLEAAVLGRSDPTWGEMVAAIVVVRPGGELDVESLRDHCAGRLARYKVPKQFDFSDAPLPRTRSGKLLRRELR